MSTKGKARPASIKDVARRAGVSLGSVSRVINNFENVSLEVRNRVSQAMAELDYQLNHAARSLRSRTSRTVGCMLTNVTNPLYASLYRAFEEKLRQSGYMVLLANSLNNAQWEMDILAMFKSRGMDGVLIAPSNERHPGVLAAIENLGIPAVILDRDMAVAQDQVQFDHAPGVKSAVSHLITLGHRDIALVVSGLPYRPMRRRVEGFRAGFAAHGLKPASDLIVKLPHSTSAGFDAAAELLMRTPRPTAILSLGTGILSDVLHAVSACRLRIPQDISIVSLGEPYFTRSHVPALSAVTNDVEVVVAQSCRLLLERMQGHAADGPCRVMVPTRFVLRDSCAAASSARSASRGWRHAARHAADPDRRDPTQTELEAVASEQPVSA